MTVTKIKERDPRFRHLEAKIGAMVLAALVGIVVILVFISRERDLFTKKFSINFISESGMGFVEGMPVKLSGFKIGRIKEMELTEVARVRVTAEINQRYREWLKEGAKARLVKEGFIGEPFVEITPGEGAGRTLEEGDTIPYEKAGGIEELINQAKPVLTEIKEIIHYANSPEGDLKVALGNIRELTTELKGSKKVLGEAIRDTNVLVKKTTALVEEISEKTSPLLDNASRAVENVEGVTSRMAPLMVKIEDLTDKVSDAAKGLPEATEKLNSIIDNVKRMTDALASETPRMREMLVNADETLRDARTVVRGVKESWPVRLMVPPVREPELVPLDGHVTGKGARDGD